MSTSIYTSLILFIFFSIVNLGISADMHAEYYEGWIDTDSSEPITPIWIEFQRSAAGKYSGWYVNRIDCDTMNVSGEMTKSGLVLKVFTGRNTIAEQFTLVKSQHGYEGTWKAHKGYPYEVRLFKTDSMYRKTMKIAIDPTILTKGKGRHDSITEIHYLMVRKGIASIKVMRERKNDIRPWISYHVIDVLKNKEIHLTDHLMNHAYAKTKIMADNHAEQEAVNQLMEYDEDDIAAMKDCGLDLDRDLHLDDVVLYPNRTAITFDYVNIFGMKEDCEYQLYPIKFTMPIKDFKQCISPGSFLARLLL
jgi:hypothetical protein